MRQKLPFELAKDRSFFESLGDWIGDVLYDELPEKGFDCRDEQIFMAYQIEKALKEKKVLFAEAGVGTGKTIAYLLPAIAYARYTGRPALIACADETLIDQLVKKGGDIEKLEQALALNIDVRLAKSRDQYLCLKRFQQAENIITEDWIDDIAFSMPEVVITHGPMRDITLYGDRSDYPTVSDEDWQFVNYNELMQCAVCDERNRCGQTLHRTHYRAAGDLIICSQDFLMEHLATKASREREGQLALLPEVSMMVLDEGHLLEYAAQKAMTYKVQARTIVSMLERLMVDGVREKTLYAMERLQDHHELFFDELRDAVTLGEERMRITKSQTLLTYGRQLIQDVDTLMEEFVFESEMYMIPEYELNMAEEFLEHYVAAMRIFVEKEDAVDWVEESTDGFTLVIMPRLITEVLQETLFSKKLPIVFSSATLSVDQDFSYIAYSLGIRDYLSFTVASPFDYESVMQIHAHQVPQQQKATMVEHLLQQPQQTLILFKSKQAMDAFRATVSMMTKLTMAFEGDRELSAIVRDFQSGDIQTLCAYHLWEGLDLPEQMLTRVIIYDLPFPPNDPLFDAKRAFAEDAFEEVELPFMQLRLQQGMGRLIRTANDYGTIELLLNEEEATLLPTLQSLCAVAPQLA